MHQHSDKLGLLNKIIAYPAQKSRLFGQIMQYQLGESSNHLIFRNYFVAIHIHFDLQIKKEQYTACIGTGCLNYFVKFIGEFWRVHCTTYMNQALIFKAT